RLVRRLEVHRRVAKTLEHEEHQGADDEDSRNHQAPAAAEQTTRLDRRRRTGRSRCRCRYCHVRCCFDSGREWLMARDRRNTLSVYTVSTTKVMPSPAAT